MSTDVMDFSKINAESSFTQNVVGGFAERESHFRRIITDKYADGRTHRCVNCSNYFKNVNVESDKFRGRGPFNVQSH